MNWKTTLVLAVIVIAFLLFKKAGQISITDARRHVENGASIIDVRSPGEFASGHLAKAENIPLDQIRTVLPRQAHDKSQVLLLHCQSGMRSAAAAKALKNMGYTNVYNLGSISRARKVVEDLD